jgi:hypothetical protein
MNNGKQTYLKSWGLIYLWFGLPSRHVHDAIFPSFNFQKLEVGFDVRDGLLGPTIHASNLQGKFPSAFRRTKQAEIVMARVG